jgi:hypothetical protein
MGLLDFLRRLFFPRPSPSPNRTTSDDAAPHRHSVPAPSENGRHAEDGTATLPTSGTEAKAESQSRKPRRTLRSGPRPRAKLAPLRHAPPEFSSDRSNEVAEIPYRFARFGVRSGGFLDLARDGDDARLQERQLPILRTPEDLATWLGIPLGKLAWLIHRFSANSRPASEREAHYHFRWERKRAGGWRLIEAPKATLKEVQCRIFEEILSRIPAHPSAHGFVPGRSIVTNAAEHVGKPIVVRLDLTNFYPTVTLARVAAIFRTIGYSREASVWMARLCTSSLPQTAAFPEGSASAIRPYLPAHLPQGACTSPALANLSAFSLDVRLSGLARSFGGTYTRYADDLTFSGPAGFRRALPNFLPLVEQVIREERFRSNKTKRRIIRSNCRQMVTGVVVNDRTNVRRADYDQLKALLTNCLRHGAQSQNRDGRDNFAAWVRGRIAHVQSLNAARGSKLLALYQQIDWR